MLKKPLNFNFSIDINILIVTNVIKLLKNIVYIKERGPSMDNLLYYN